jgi:DNA invertase Pin-like site-specific DNA recombinase
VERSGFERLLAAVCAGEVGAIFAFEASRLARNGQEWHTLLELCAVVDTMLIDTDAVYDPKFTNDRLLLGLKGDVERTRGWIVSRTFARGDPGEGQARGILWPNSRGIPQDQRWAT